MRNSVFDIYHPGVVAMYLLVVLCFTMACIQPIFISISLVAAIAYSVYLRGAKAVLKSLAWQLPLFLLIAIINPLVNQTGVTVLFRYFGHRGFYLESLIYGIFMGAMLISVLIWFSNLTQLLTSDKMMQLTGRVMPTIGLMVTMIMRLVPQFVRRGRDVLDAQNACTAARLVPDGPREETSGKRGSKRKGLKSIFRVSSVLMGWGLEDSLDTAEAMKTRGWGAVSKRSTYKRSDFRINDGIVLAIIILLTIASAVLAVIACGDYQFYPRIDPVAAWWHYIPYVLLLAMPVFLKIKERLVWIH